MFKKKRAARRKKIDVAKNLHIIFVPRRGFWVDD